MTPIMFGNSRTSVIPIAAIGLAMVLGGMGLIAEPGVTRIRQLFWIELPNAAIGGFMLIPGAILCLMAVGWAIWPNRVLVDRSGIYFTAPFKRIHYPWAEIIGYSEGPGNHVRLHLTPGAEQRLGRDGKFAFIPKPPLEMEGRFSQLYHLSRQTMTNPGHSRR